MAARADLATRFQSKYRDDELPALVADVARAASPDAPLTVSTRRWDAHRCAGGHPHAPSARQITSRLNPARRGVLSWQRILELSFATDARRRQSLAAGARRAEQHHLTVAHLEAALRRIARQLGTDTVEPGQYEEARAAAVAQLSEPARQLLDEQLPTIGQIERIARNARAERGDGADTADWDYALGLAGLHARAAINPPPQTRRKALEIVEVLALFSQLAGALPTYKQARGFAERNQIAMRDIENGRSWNEYVASFKDQLRAEGEQVPPGHLARRRYVIDIPDDVLTGLPRRYGHKWQENPDRALDALDEYLNALPSRQQPRTSHYRSVKSRDGRADWPGLTTYTTLFGGFEQAIALVRARSSSKSR